MKITQFSLAMIQRAFLKLSSQLLSVEIFLAEASVDTRLIITQHFFGGSTSPLTSPS